jgi:hypothetical protein
LFGDILANSDHIIFPEFRREYGGHNNDHNKLIWTKRVGNHRIRFLILNFFDFWAVFRSFFKELIIWIFYPVYYLYYTHAGARILKYNFPTRTGEVKDIYPSSIPIKY